MGTTLPFSKPVADRILAARVPFGLGAPVIETTPSALQGIRGVVVPGTSHLGLSVQWLASLDGGSGRMTTSVTAGAILDPTTRAGFLLLLDALAQRRKLDPSGGVRFTHAGDSWRLGAGGGSHVLGAGETPWGHEKDPVTALSWALSETKAVEDATGRTVGAPKVCRRPGTDTDRLTLLTRVEGYCIVQIGDFLCGLLGLSPEAVGSYALFDETTDVWVTAAEGVTYEQACAFRTTAETARRSIGAPSVRSG